MKLIQGLQEDPLSQLDTSALTTKKGVMEVSCVANALSGLSYLIQMSFGEAGAQIIGSSLKDNKLDVDSSGKVVHALFGFCDIRNFTDLTEVLQEDVVRLVNNVGQIVHDAVVANTGAPNKNIGDAFLLVWKPKGGDGVSIKHVAENALRSYITIILEMQRDAEPGSCGGQACKAFRTAYQGTGSS
eukprot:CAMPEP_0172039918 /NCGR_PEP_ID=MMETSP1041-20130122/24197_1 /TAXON_ID=464988 /ORGANISM="Hemiselmis andersenii, Strain CCMP439" /LENGTH=185 /DNA_ID=CAMNT_0012697733 /DNA_START=18 /DNA_END=575 /DNA_ORIENTATION=+